MQIVITEKSVKEISKRLRQETIPATYNPDFDKDVCMNVIDMVIDEWCEFKKQELLRTLQPKDCVIKFTLTDAQKSVLNMFKDDIHRYKKDIKNDMRIYKMLSISDIMTYLNSILEFGANHEVQECIDNIKQSENDYRLYKYGWTKDPFKHLYIACKNITSGPYKVIIGYNVTIKIAFNDIEELE